MTPQRRSDSRMTSDPVVAALRRQAMIVEHLHDGVIVTDPDGMILDWNPAAQRMFGYTLDEVAGRNVELLNRPGEGPVVTQAIKESLAATGRWTAELTLLARDGAERDVEAVVIGLRDGR